MWKITDRIDVEINPFESILSDNLPAFNTLIAKATSAQSSPNICERH